MSVLNSLIFKNKLFSTAVKHVYLQKGCCSSKPVEAKPPPQSTNYSDIHRRLHPPNNLERKMLVWTGLYKKLEDVPKIVPVETIEKARNKMRIKVSNWMMAATVVGCIIMAITGKRRAERGESIAKMNEDWHKEMNKIQK
uniref:Uncharacterized protein n=1 Tax=Riptortus pedestris TaxID=329032 RepID=R4WU40_RIPPE|nr:conserved hypothetical protein [Riptortus pedestris]